MNTLKAGFSRVEINPPMGIDIAGYFIERHAERILDNLYTCALALSVADGTTSVMITLDSLYVQLNGCDVIRDYLSERFSLPRNAFFIGSSHSHTAPTFQHNHEKELIRDYFRNTMLKIGDAVAFALADMKPAKMGYGIGTAPRISFGRRYRMKDGSVRTNPGVLNPDIVESIGEVDERVSVVRFDREGADDIVLINFGTHPDTVGGNVISADWPGFVRTTMEAAVGNVKCLVFNGAEGDVNHVNVMPRGGERNGLTRDFDDVDRGYSHAKHMGNVIAGAALQVYEKLVYSDVDKISYSEKVAKLPANTPSPDEIPLALEYQKLYEEGRTDEIPFTGMGLTTALANARRILKLKDGPEFFEVPLSGLAIGRVAFIGIPGEPFTAIGMQLKESRGDFDMVIPCALTNGARGYFPGDDSFAEGGYETSNSNYRSGVQKNMVDTGKELLKML